MAHLGIQNQGASASKYQGNARQPRSNEYLLVINDMKMSNEAHITQLENNQGTFGMTMKGLESIQATMGTCMKNLEHNQAIIGTCKKNMETTQVSFGALMSLKSH